MDQNQNFAAKREAYTAARERLQQLIDSPDKSVPVAEYRTQLQLAHVATGAAHDAMLEAFSAPSPSVPHTFLDDMAQAFADASLGKDPWDDEPGATPEVKTKRLMPTVIHVHHDTEAHARSFNEGYEAAVTQGLADDPTLAGDWLDGKLAEAWDEGCAEGFARGDDQQRLEGYQPNPYRSQP